MIQHGTGRAAAQAVAVAIKRVLADVEIEGRQVDRGKGEHRAEHTLEIERGVALADLLIQIGQTAKHPTFQTRHVLGRDAVGCR